MELASLVLRHPASTREALARAERLRDGLAAQLAPEQMAAAQGRAQA